MSRKDHGFDVRLNELELYYLEGGFFARRAFFDVTEDREARDFLSQAWHWQREYGAGEWWYKTRDAWWDETRLSRRHQEKARKRLKDMGILEERYSGTPRKTHFRLNGNRLLALVQNALSSREEEIRRKKAYTDSRKKLAASG